MSWTPFLLSFELALVSTAVLFVLLVPLAWLFATRKFRFQPFFEALFSLPLVLPPTVMGFYVLVFLSPHSPFGAFVEEVFGVRLVFNFAGLVVASVIYSLPFMFSPLLAGFRALPRSLFEASYSLGKGWWTTLFRVGLPNIKPNLLTAVVISFAHTLGEFGIVLMIGGSLEGKTKVVSIAIYDAVELLDYRLAHSYALVMLGISLVVLLVVNLANRRLG